jgi:hypothetical protein
MTEPLLLSASAVAGGAADSFRLACACCRWPPSSDRDESVSRLARSIADWAQFVRIARRHRIVALVHRALVAARVMLPHRISQQLAEETRQTAVRTLTNAAEAARLQGLLDGARIANVILKGAPLAQMAYGSLSLKFTKDIDLLIPPERVADALALLQSDGYAIWPQGSLNQTQLCAMVRLGKELELVHRITGLQVELHWRAAHNRHLSRSLDALSSSQEVVASGRLRLRTLAPEEHFVYLCTHGALHAWWRINWLADLNALLASRNGEDLSRLFGVARARGVGLCAGQALLLCHLLFKLKLPAQLLVELESDPKVARLIRIAIDCMFGAHPEIELPDRRFASLRMLLLPFLLGQGWRYCAAQCRIASVNLGDVVRYPLPTSLYFLYPVLRLPSWLWRQVYWVSGSTRWSLRSP